MTFPWLGLISMSILLSALSRCNQHCVPSLEHGKIISLSLVPSRTVSLFPLWSEVIWLQIGPKSFPSATLLHVASSTKSSLCGIVWDLLNSLLHCITSFLPLLCAQGTLSLQSPFLPARSPSELCLFPFTPHVPLEAKSLYIRMLKTRIEAGGNSTHFPLDSDLLSCLLIFVLKSLTLFNLVFQL